MLSGFIFIALASVVTTLPFESFSKYSDNVPYKFDFLNLSYISFIPLNHSSLEYLSIKELRVPDVILAKGDNLTSTNATEFLFFLKASTFATFDFLPIAISGNTLLLPP